MPPLKVDTDGEWYVSRTTGVLTVFSSGNVNPGDRNLVLDRGDAVKEGVLLRSQNPQLTQLIPVRMNDEC